MFCTIPTTVQAADAKITVSGASAERSQMVYLTVSLEGCDKANTLGISMEYDSDVLKKVASDCTWTEKGVLQDFDVAKNSGVWATKKAKDLNGEICTLAFRVKENAPIGDTKVACTVIVKKDSKVVGTYSAKGTVSVTCEHSYGEWSQKDGNTHRKVCKYCQYEKTASHKWDEGVVTKHPTENEEGVKLYTCDVCGGSKQAAISVNGDIRPIEPDDPIQTPTEGEEQDKSIESKPKNPVGGSTISGDKTNVSGDGTVTETDNHSSEEATAQENGSEEHQNTEDSEKEASETVNSKKTNNTTYYLVGSMVIATIGIGTLMAKRLKIKK